MNEVKLKDTKEYQKLPFRGKWAIDNIIEYTMDIAAEKDKLEKQIETLTNFQPAQKLKDYIARPKVWEEEKDNWGYTKKNTSGWAIQKPVVTPEQLQEWLNKNEPIYQENIQICELNKKAQTAAFKFIEKLGIKQKKFDYPSGRSKKKVEITCDWVNEFNNHFITSCSYGWEQDNRWVKEEIEKINKYSLEKKEAENKILKAKETELKNQEKIALIIRLVEKYKLSFNSPIPGANDVLSELIKKNKYLYLAHYLAKNRGDWNDGCSYAETGLDYFVGKPEENYLGENDDAIYENIQKHISNWQGDGRCFRDTEYSYDYLFGIVERNAPELYSDYCKLKDLGGDDY